MFNRANRPFALRLLWSLIAYAVFLAAYLLGGWLGVDPPWQVALASAHVLAAAYVVYTFARFFVRMDELQKRMQNEAITFALAGTALLTLAYGYLESLGFPKLGWVFVFPLMLALWFAGMSLAERRYE